MLTKVARYSQRIKELGCKNLVLTLKYRLRKKRFRIRFYKTALKSAKNHINTGQIEWQKDFKIDQLKNTHKILESAWQQQKNIFYQDIKIICPPNMTANEYNPDIKVPWEMSRFQNIFGLGESYKKTGDQKFADEFKNQIEDWIEQNPYLCGVNWVCPMEAGIRAINWVHGFDYFKDDKIIPVEFWQKFTNSLHDHMQFLENNWEWSDKPNNHYLADLLGYFYLCEFFELKNKKKWVIKTLLEQFFKQILPDGTCYEGSTNYHKLDTEIFLHFKQLCQETNTQLPQEFYDRLTKMEQFLRDCCDGAGNMVQIGDNDSGKITTGICKSARGECGPILRYNLPSKSLRMSGQRIEPCQRIHRFEKRSNQDLVKTYPCFGLTIIKNKEMHITFRHATFNKLQPTGHFHQDQLAITLSFKGIPILVDPGTGVYTSNSFIRNQLRSFESHNTFHPVQKYNLDELFQLELEKTCKQINQAAHRKIEFTNQNRELKIEDSIKSSDSKIWQWNWIFAPEIDLEKIDANFWKIKRKNDLLMLIQSPLDLKLCDWIYSSEYGNIQACKKLVAQRNCITQQSYVQTILKLY